MLEELSIKNFAIIDSVNIEFNSGFTVLSGETGAGKSILIGALSFLLGGKADVSVIRKGASEASVSAVFYLNPEKISPEAFSWLSEHAIETDDNRLLLRRIIRENGKSSSYAGSTPVTRSDIQTFSSFLIDIHGQHEHQSLMKVSEHRKFLDARAGLTQQVSDFSHLFSILVEKKRLLESINDSDSRRKEKIEMLKFSLDEIKNAKLKKGEDEELESEEARLSSFEKLYSDIDSINSHLSGTEESVVSLLKKSSRECQHALEFDKSLEKLFTRLEAVFYEVSDLSEEFSSYQNHLVFDPSRLSEVQERLSVLYNLKKKYASSVSSSIDEVIKYSEDAQKSLEELENSFQNKEKLQAEVSDLEKTVYIEAKKISVKRKEYSKTLSNEVENLLSSLGMKGAGFCVSINDKSGTSIEQKCGQYGMDNIEFLIRSNAGSDFLPLAKIASGGELSRVMLALKTIFAQNDSVETLIFDEIDTGIGGEVAVSVGLHIKNLSKNKQIFCITHLASIAVYADNQIKIEKGIVSGKTESNLHEVSGEERVKEIARMLSGDSNDEQSLEHARSMLEKFC